MFKAAGRGCKYILVKKNLNRLIETDKINNVCRRLSLFSSMRTGLALLLLVGAAAIAGSFLPAKMAAVIVYHSGWFKILLTLLSINILLCTWRRSRQLWRETFGPGPAYMAGLPGERELITKLPGGLLRNRAVAYLAGRKFKVRYPANTDNPGMLLAVKNRFAPWGAVTAHLAILVIVLGALYGNIFGFSYQARLPVGESQAIVNPDGKTLFSLLLVDFDTIRYPDGSVSDWVSRVILQDGDRIIRREIKVNQPLEFGGVRVYQSFYGSLLTVGITGSDGKTIQVETAERDWLPINETNGLMVQLLKYIPDYDPGQPMVSRSSEAVNPHVLLLVKRVEQSPAYIAVPLNGSAVLDGRMRANFTAIRPFSGLLIKSDPGLPVVWTGFGLLAIGFFIGWSRRRSLLWLNVEPVDGLTRVRATPIYNNRESLIIVDELLMELSQLSDPKRTS